MDLFERVLMVPQEEVELLLREEITWLDHLLNPRYLRGSDFLMRWSQGRWSEERLVEALNQTGKYIAIPYGPSSVAPASSRELELYLDLLEAVGLGKAKRPDLLVFPQSDAEFVESTLQTIDETHSLPFEIPETQSHVSAGKLPFVNEDDDQVKALLSRAVAAVECETSLWIGKQMPHYGKAMKPMRRLGGRQGMRKNAVLPTLIIEEEDRPGLTTWQEETGVPMHVWHAFYDVAFGIAFDQAETVIREGLIDSSRQTFQAPGGATTSKIMYKIYYHYCYGVAEAIEPPTLVADKIVDKSGHILPYVRFEGGSMRLDPEALAVLENARLARTAR